MIQVQSAAVKGPSIICCDEAVHPWLFWPSFALHLSSEMFLLICEWLLSAYNWVFILGTYAICGRIISEKGVLVYYSLFSSTPNPCPPGSTLPNAQWSEMTPHHCPQCYLMFALLRCLWLSTLWSQEQGFYFMTGALTDGYLRLQIWETRDLK